MTNVAYPSIEDYDDIDTKNAYHTMLEQGIAPEKALAEAQRISRDNARTPMQWDDSLMVDFPIIHHGSVSIPTIKKSTQPVRWQMILLSFVFIRN